MPAEPRKSALWPSWHEDTLRYLGPPPEEGPLPAVFYLALGARASLEDLPLAAPAQSLASRGMRVFSLDLPFHEQEADPQQALAHWAKQLRQGEDPLARFIERTARCIDALWQEGSLSSVSLMGLSRGGLLAALVCAQSQHVRRLVAFAPLVRLAAARECSDLSSHVATRYDLTAHTASLAGKELAVWIGNRDHRVGTASSFEWVSAVAEAQARHGHRICHAELNLRPSIGLQGHGTSEESFEQGVSWICRT